MENYITLIPAEYLSEDTLIFEGWVWRKNEPTASRVQSVAAARLADTVCLWQNNRMNLCLMETWLNTKGRDKESLILLWQGTNDILTNLSPNSEAEMSCFVLAAEQSRVIYRGNRQRLQWRNTSPKDNELLLTWRWLAWYLTMRVKQRQAGCRCKRGLWPKNCMTDLHVAALIINNPIKDRSGYRSQSHCIKITSSLFLWADLLHTATLCQTGRAESARSTAAERATL